MFYFQIVSGVASIIGLALVVINMFPRHARVRNYFVFFSFGLFVGSFMGGIRRIEVNFPVAPLAWGILFFYVACLIGLAVVLLVGVLAADKEKMNRCFQFVGNGFGVLLVSGLLVAFFSGLATVANSSVDVSLDDLYRVAAIHEQEGRIDKAIDTLTLYASRCGGDDPRRKAALKRIAHLQQERSRGFGP